MLYMAGDIMVFSVISIALHYLEWPFVRAALTVRHRWDTGVI